MVSDTAEWTSERFLLEEYRDLYQNVMHLENKLFNRLSLFTTFFLGILTASVALTQLGGRQSLSLPDALALMTLPYALLFLAGRFELRMTTELRARKIKFIEGIIKIREYFVAADPTIEDYLILPSKIEKAPPYLRIGSHDWYQLLYLCVLNTLSFLAAWTGIPFAIRFLAQRAIGPQFPVALVALFILATLAWELWGLIASGVIFWIFSYRSVMNFCQDYDTERERRMRKRIQYDLMEQSRARPRLSYF